MFSVHACMASSVESEVKPQGAHLRLPQLVAHDCQLASILLRHMLLTSLLGHSCADYLELSVGQVCECSIMNLSNPC